VKIRIFRAVICLLLVFSALFAICACDDKKPEPNGPSSSVNGDKYSVILGKTDYTFTEIGETYKIVCSVSPEKKGVDFDFTSSNPEIVSVTSAGVVTAVANGVSAVTVSCVIDGAKYEAVCAFSVEDPFGDDEMTEEEKNLYADPGPAVPPIPEPVIDEDGYLCSDNLREYNIYNSDAVAWLYVAGTDINIPVAQSDSTSPEYYLDKGFNHFLKYSGSAFLDYRCSVKGKGYVTNQQTVIYGHARGKDVFDQLERTMIKEEWYSDPSNRYIYLNTILEDTVWEIFAVYYSDLSIPSVLEELTTLDYTLTAEQVRENYTDAEIESAIRLGTMDRLLQDRQTLYRNMLNWRNRMAGDDSRYAAFQRILGTRNYEGNTVRMGDKVLTLMTCADTGTPIRFVVQARLVAVREK